MAGIFSCTCGYDCRLLFRLRQDRDTEVIILLDICTHDEVY